MLTYNSAPHKHIGRTASTHPTFAWFVPVSKPYPLEFSLYKYVSSGNIQLSYKTQLKSSPGIMKLSLPKNNPGLAFGERYIWQVAILCDPNPPLSDLVASSEIEVVKMLPSLSSEIDRVGDRSNILHESIKEQQNNFDSCDLLVLNEYNRESARQLSLKRYTNNYTFINFLQHPQSFEVFRLAYKEQLELFLDYSHNSYYIGVPSEMISKLPTYD